MLGQVIKHYRIDSLIGDGGMGAVYRGTDLNLDRPVAIKVLHPQLMRDPALRDRFQEEARIQARLNHPNIVTVHDYDAETGAIIMEYVPGRGLNELIEQQAGPLPLARCLEIFGQVLSAINYAHTYHDDLVTGGVIHRDLKPSNILIVPAGNQVIAKVTDFGIAKIVGDVKNRTATGVMMGTLRYMSPEQIRSAKDVGPQSDIFALGVTLYQMATGKAPFDADTEYDIMNQILSGTPTQPSLVAAEVPAGLEQVIGKALAKNVEERFQSCEEFLTALAAAGGPEISKFYPAPVPLPSATEPPRAVSLSPATDPVFRTAALNYQSGSASRSPAPVPPGPSFWEEIQPTVDAALKVARPTLLFLHHNSYLFFILVSLLTGILTRYFNREHAGTLSSVFLWLPLLFVLSHCLKRERAGFGLAQVASLMAIPCLTVLLLGLVEGTVSTERLHNRLELLKMTALLGLTLYGPALLIASLLTRRVLARLPASLWSAQNFSWPDRWAQVRGVLQGTDANDLFWRILPPMALVAGGLSLFQILSREDQILFGTMILALYTIFDCMITARAGAAVARISAIILAYFLVSVLGTAIWDHLTAQAFWPLLRLAVKAEIIFALPGLIIAILARNIRTKTRSHEFS